METVLNNIKFAITKSDSSVGDLEQIYATFGSESEFLNCLIELLNDQDYQKQASWLLKTWLDSGNKISHSQSKIIYSSFDDIRHWEAKLNILKCLAYFTIDDTDKKEVYNFLRITLCDTNTFVRAWSYNGFYELSMQHPEFTAETKEFFKMAMRDEPASVQARIRNIIKQGFEF